MNTEDLIAEYEIFVMKAMRILGDEARTQPFEKASPIEIDVCIERFGLQVPDDIRYFWQHFPVLFDAWRSKGPDDDGNVNGLCTFGAGFDFIDVRLLNRDLPDFRSLADLYLDSNQDSTDGDYWWEYYLHRDGFQLTYEEPQIVFYPATGGVMYRVYDGTSPEFAIADNFTEFFEHYLSAGCFRRGDFAAYWELVKDSVPQLVPVEENKWLRFYREAYEQ